MENVIALLKLFGERYVYCDDEQAQEDALINREDLVKAFNAIMDYLRNLDKGV